jgi:hypothetical protein
MRIPAWLVLAAWCAAIGLSDVQPAAAQPILERLEERIRNRLQQPAEPVLAPPDQTPPDDVEPGYFGVLADDKDTGGRGVRVLEVRQRGPAEKAGLRKGDLITALAGTPLRGMSDMADVLIRTSAGDTISADLFRDGRTQRVTVTLARQPAQLMDEPELPLEAIPVPPPQPLERPQDPFEPPADPPAEDSATIAQLLRRIEQLERRVAELEQALSAAQPQP